MATLSKSKLIAFRQCPKRLWLEVHRPQLRQDSDQAKAGFATGHSVGAIARRLYDPKGKGEELDLGTLGMKGLLQRTQTLVEERRPIFEAGFSVGERGQGALALADVLLPETRSGRPVWRMIEVKSSTSVKDYHRDDASIQHYVVTNAGVELSSVRLAYIDSKWVYPGGDDYAGLLVEEDLTQEVRGRGAEVESWISEAHKVVSERTPPEALTGSQCKSPFECGFIAHCSEQETQRLGAVEHPVQWLPNVRKKALMTLLADRQVRSLTDVPDDLLSVEQLRVKTHSLAGTTYFDVKGAAQALRSVRLPALFLDFETIAFAVPQWAGTRPYQQIPFQFSLHRVGRTGKVTHQGFLDLSGGDPSLAFTRALLKARGDGKAPIVVYNASFESARIADLAARFPKHAKALKAINARIVDLLPITREHYYHPDQCGSWSIKAVLPTIAPELDYAELDEVQDGGKAQLAYLEGVHSDTTEERRTTIRGQLWDYCRLDTFAMVRLWAYLGSRGKLAGMQDLAPSQDMTST